ILYPRLLELAECAAAANVQLTIDAEEANRLDVSLDLIERLSRETQLDAWSGLGIALQAYSKRALSLIDWLSSLSDETGRRFIVRLVKGAYWDTEIKHAQVLGVASYPVYTTKAATDLSYLVCAQKLLAKPDVFFPQFATHNAHTLATVLELAKSPMELQRLHGMGELLYAQAAAQLETLPQVRVYAPVGPHKHLLGYLIRRLLENGANSSFVNRFLDAETSVDDLVIDPRKSIEAAAKSSKPIPIPTPPNLYLPERANSPGYDLEDPDQLDVIVSAMTPFANHQWGENADEGLTVVNPGRNDDIVGYYRAAKPADIEVALTACVQAQPAWNGLGGGERAARLRRVACGFEKHHGELVALLVREAGKTLDDALTEIREAWDFCHYYAHQAELHFQSSQVLPGPTGESNLLNLQGRGTFLCISPWNFPLAIFTGQVCAALAAGNSVVAKPSEQTTLIAMHVVTLMHAAGIPACVLHLLAGEGSVVGRALAEDERVSGVAFTGSTATAKLLQRTLAARPGAIVPLIAETGGQNAMIVDSTAMIEQVVDDAIVSAFGSAGQRCSALRVLHLQHDIADEVMTMLKGAMDALVVGDPWSSDTDVGPIIDEHALNRLQQHVDELSSRCLHRAALPDGLNGHYIAPQVFEISSITELAEENFGPLLHVVRYSRDRLDSILAELNATGYGLTLGIHSRNNQFIDRVYAGTTAGNVYVNRNMVGAVVGVQPFGGQGLSGTGPKAGGPNYLPRFASERTLTNNVAAIGGNLDLLTRE
ncbi:MAG: bifunctional proline dehydrogenase/L-glutamate gamma-semialdehyde dehydrogenase PutA, partial [Gammaproteobacteria bacterium]|nr:bifunctional proline dehydrogenase/L-glutamate gamma-semialdehyde dehydrogenase PutA [Gammaproteobacteria bacterium]